MDTKLLAQRNSARITRLTDGLMSVVYSAALDTAANAITISADNDGNAFALKCAELNFLVPAGCSAPDGTSAQLYIRINDVETNYADSFFGYLAALQMYAGFVRNLYAQIKSTFNAFEGGMTHYASGVCRDSVATAGLPNYSGMLSGVTSITKFYAWLHSGYTLPAGTMIELRGQKA